MTVTDLPASRSRAAAMTPTAPAPTKSTSPASISATAPPSVVNGSVFIVGALVEDPSHRRGPDASPSSVRDAHAPVGRGCDRERRLEHIAKKILGENTQDDRATLERPA